MRFSFFMLYSDPTTYTLPQREELETETKKQALLAFAQAHQLSVAEMDPDTVWFYTKDGAAVQYSVTDISDRVYANQDSP